MYLPITLDVSLFSAPSKYLVLSLRKLMQLATISKTPPT